MKTIKIFITLFLLVSVTSFFSCKDDEHDPSLTKIEASELDYIANGPDFVLTEPGEGANPLVFTATWTETQFYLDGNAKPMPAGPVTYNLQMDKAGNNFSSPVTIASATEPYADVFVKEINTLLLKTFGAKAGDPFDVELRLVTSYGLNNPDNHVVSTNFLYLTLTPYQPSNTEVKNIYIVGNMNAWNNMNTDFMMYRDNTDPNNTKYTYTGFFKKQDDGNDCFFKFISQENLGDWNKMYVDKGNGVLALGGDNDGAAFHVAEGYYTITLDIQAMTYTIEAYDASSAVTWDAVNFVGAFCDWGNNAADPNMIRSEYDPHQWHLDIELNNIDYGVKFRANHSWDNRWCPADPNNQPYGKAEFNPTNQDNNIDIANQGLGQYNVRFNDLTGHYIVMHQ